MSGGQPGLGDLEGEVSGDGVRGLAAVEGNELEERHTLGSFGAEAFEQVGGWEGFGQFEVDGFILGGDAEAESLGEDDAGAGIETLGACDGDLGAAEHAFPEAHEIMVAEEAEVALLGEADAEAVGRGDEVGHGIGHLRGRAWAGMEKGPSFCRGNTGASQDRERAREGFRARTRRAGRVGAGAVVCAAGEGRDPRVRAGGSRRALRRSVP